jgi:hypothetical protein
MGYVVIGPALRQARSPRPAKLLAGDHSLSEACTRSRCTDWLLSLRIVNAPKQGSVIYARMDS